MIEHYRNWGLLYEDQFQCFSKAIEIETNTDVLVISHFKSNRIKKSVKTLLPDLLNHYLDSFEDENGFHIVLKYLKGTALSKYLKSHSIAYETRVQLCYQWIKSIIKYDQFPDALKIQLVDYEQLIFFNDQIFSREWIDFSANEEVDYIKILKQLGQTLEVLFPDAPTHQSQFIEAMTLGKHEMLSLSMFRKAFKDVFLYEKEEAIQQISFEFDIVLNDINAGPPVKLPKKEKTELFKEEVHPSLISTETETEAEASNTNQFVSVETSAIPKFESSSVSNEIKVMKIKADEFLEETHEEKIEPLPHSNDIHYSSPLSEYIKPDEGTPVLEEASDEGSETKEEPESNLIDKNEDSSLLLNADLEDDTQEVLQIQELHRESSTLNSNEKRPSSKVAIESTKYWLEDDSEIDDYAKEMDALFEEDDYTEKKWHFKSKPILLATLVGVLILFSIFFIGSKLFTKDEPLAAQFNIEKQLETSRVPVINTSTGGKKIQSYLWEIYYQDALIKTYNDKDLELSLETPGAYRIVLKIKDTKGNWSAPYERTYHYIP